MPRLSPDDKASLKVRRKLERLLRKMGAENSTEWENEFAAGVKSRLEEYGQAFHDAEKGDKSLPLSLLQNFKVTEITREMKLREKIGMRAARRQVFNKMGQKRPKP